VGLYGSVIWAGDIAFAVAVFVGCGLVGPGLIFDPPAALTWLGYLLRFVGGEEGAVGGGGLAIPIAFAVAGVLYAVLAPVLSPERGRSAGR
jgi:hypothetical protein